jgi:pyrophosphate--fructose-6-phosphate 1-phosphotransferase
MNYGVALIPEGLIEFIPEVGSLISQLSDVLAHDQEGGGEFEKIQDLEGQLTWLKGQLDGGNFSVLESLPKDIHKQLFLDRDSHGNVQVSLIETEKLMIEMVKQKLHEWKSEGKYQGSFKALNHFFGYEGRCAFPQILMLTTATPWVSLPLFSSTMGSPVTYPLSGTPINLPHSGPAGEFQSQ